MNPTAETSVPVYDVETEDIGAIVEIIRMADLDISRASEKLSNMHLLIMHLMAWDNYDAIFPISFEKSLEFDLISGIINSEVKEMEISMRSIETEVSVTREKAVSFRDHNQYALEKLNHLQTLLNKSKHHVSEVKIQSAKLERTFSEFRLNTWNSQLAMTSASNESPKMGQMTFKRLAAEFQLQALRLLEKSLAREMQLEKQLAEAKQSEHQLTFKFQRMEKFISSVEETAELMWGTFLEAENKAEILGSISKELLHQSQIDHFNINSSHQRESNLAFQLKEQTHKKEQLDRQLKTLETIIAQLTSKNTSLEEHLKTHEHSKKQIASMVESLKETIYESERRAEMAEQKATELTAASLELTEELNDVKASRDEDLSKADLTEKQVRELEIQLQHSKAAADASQEQQNMLYTAIWDMETLIEDLKAKLSQAEIKSEAAEDHCKRLSEANMKLHEEVSLLKAKVEMLQGSFAQAEKQKSSYAQDIKLKTQLLMDAVTQLAKQREFIQNQVFSPTKKKFCDVNSEKCGSDGTLFEIVM